MENYQEFGVTPRPIQVGTSPIPWATRQRVLSIMQSLCDTNSEKMAMRDVLVMNEVHLYPVLQSLKQAVILVQKYSVQPGVPHATPTYRGR